jgi:hypothetical protein
MRDVNYTMGLLIGAALLLIAGLVFTWLEIMEYGFGAQPPTAG